MKDSFLIRVIGHEAFWITALCTLLIPQVASSIQVFSNNNTQYEHPWFAWCYAIGIDLAVLIFSVRGKMRYALIYLILMIAQALIGQLLPGKSVYGIVLVHTALPITIFTFTHLFYYRKKAQSERDEMQSKAQSSTEEAQISAMLAQGVRFEAQPYICPECGKAASSSKKLNGHISGHKMKGEWTPEEYGDWETQNEKRAALVNRYLDLFSSYENDHKSIEEDLRSKNNHQTKIES